MAILHTARENKNSVKEVMRIPVVRIDMFKGRTLAQKKVLVEKVTDAIVEAVDVPKESVTVILRDIDRENFAQGGTLFSEKV